MKGVLILLSAVMVASGARMAFKLPAGSETIIPNMDTSFSCADRQYGYYADVNNNCQIFHVCLPVPKYVGEENNVEQFSFMCGNATVFNQKSMTCTYTEDSIPCEESEKYYSLNEEFGQFGFGRGVLEAIYLPQTSINSPMLLNPLPFKTGEKSIPMMPISSF